MEEIYSQNSATHVGYLIGQARHLLFRARQEEVAEYNVSPRQTRIIDILYHIGHKVTLAELAKYTGRTLSSISVQLNKMERDGLVKKTQEKPKSNLLTFELEQKGHDIYNSCHEMRAEEKIMSTLSEEERQQLISLLRKVIKMAEKYR